MKAEFDTDLLARQLSMAPSRKAVEGNLVLIKAVRDKLDAISDDLDKFVKATQGLCAHEETELELDFNGRDGWTYCKICSKEL